MDPLDQAELLLKAAFSDTTREPRSLEYKQGVMAILIHRCALIKPVCPYAAGTVQRDAWLAGTDEGHSIWRCSMQD